MPRRSYSRSRSASYDRRDRGRGYDRGRNYSRDQNRGRPRSRSPDGYRGGGGPPRLNAENQVYVARFGRRTTENELKKAFEVYGYIEKIDLKEGRGFGFIYYENRRDAEDAIEDMNGRSLPHEDERLVVEKAGGGRRRPRRSRSRDGRPRGPDICYNCNKEGHHAKDCDQSPKRREQRGQDGRCFICDEKGHKKIDCPQRREGGGGRRDFYRRSRSPQRRNRSRSRSGSGKKRREYRSPRSRDGRKGGGFRNRSGSRSFSPRDRKFKSKGRSNEKHSQSQKFSQKPRTRSLSSRSNSRNGPGAPRNKSEERVNRRTTSRSKSNDNRSKSPIVNGKLSPIKSPNDAETDSTAITQLQRIDKMDSKSQQNQNDENNNNCVQ